MPMFSKVSAALAPHMMDAAAFDAFSWRGRPRLPEPNQNETDANPKVGPSRTFEMMTVRLSLFPRQSRGNSPRSLREGKEICFESRCSINRSS